MGCRIRRGPAGRLALAAVWRRFRRGCGTGRDQGRPAPHHGSPSRAHAGVRLGLLQVLLGPMLAPFWVLGGERDFSEWLVAVGPSVRATVPVSRAAQVLLFAGVDYYLRRFELTAHGRRVLATPRVAMTFGVGVAWRLI